jgi:sigma-B regulation protein RsbU (phosphoserine phosphatase)
VIFYSDGVTEARDREGGMFGVERLVACVRENGAREPTALVEAVRAAVVAFSGSPSLADDLTCVVAKLVPHEAPAARADLRIGSAPGELRRARGFVEGFCRALPGRPLGEDAVTSLVLAADEAACNIMKHAYQGRDDQRIDILAEAFRDRVAIRLRYQGAPFDPSTIPPPSFDGSRECGFGVFMIASSVDAVRYYRDDLRRSCIRLEKRREAA